MREGPSYILVDFTASRHDSYIRKPIASDIRDRRATSESTAALQLLLVRAAAPESPGISYLTRGYQVPAYIAAHLVDSRCDRRESVAPPWPLVAAAAVTATIDSTHSGIFTVAPVPPPLAPSRFHPARGRKAGYLTCLFLPAVHLLFRAGCGDQEEEDKIGQEEQNNASR